MSNLHQWQGRWISIGQTLGAFENKTFPAPCFRKEFEITEPIASAKVLLCGLGFHELCINGISRIVLLFIPSSQIALPGVYFSGITYSAGKSEEI